MKLTHKTNILVLFVFVTSLFNFSNAQSFERFSNKEGFNQNTTSSIEKDKYGFLWFGTPNGLIKYDGYEFKTYTTQSKTNGHLSSNFISHLYSDNKGILWIGTNLGVNVYIPWLEKFYTVPLPKNILITHINVDPEGVIWFSGRKALYNCKLLDIENGTFEVSKNIVENVIKTPMVTSFVFKDVNRIVLGTTIGLKQLTFDSDKNNYQLSNLDKLNNLPINTITYINNILWIGTQKGLFKATLDENRIFIIDSFDNLKENVPPVVVNTIFEGKDGQIWIGTKENGLYKYNPQINSFNHYFSSPKDEHSLSSNYINTIFQDDFNVLWIGTAQAGINKLDLTQKKFTTYTSNPYDSNSLADNLTTAILEDKNGKVWVSSFNSTLSRSTNSVIKNDVNKLKFKEISEQLKLPNGAIIRCIFEDNKGFIWFGTDNRLIVYNPSKDVFKRVVVKNKLSPKIYNAFVRKIVQLDENHLLLAGNHLILVENPWANIENKNKNHFISTSSEYSLQNILVQSIYKDVNKKLWIGTNRGLFLGTYRQNNIEIVKKYTTHSKDKIKLSNNNIFSLHKENNHLWVGTFGGGLNKITLDNEGMPKQIESFRKSDVLPDDAIYGILQEGNSNLWLSTDMGLVNFNINNNSTNEFNVKDGLAQNNYRQNSYTKGRTGYFYFGGLNGLTVFNPKEIKLNTQPPEILITSLLLNNKTVNINEEVNGNVILSKSISETEKIEINQADQIISFNLVVKHTTQPSKNKIAYKLQGFNDDWIVKTSGKTLVTYTNLSAGKYVFKVKAANGDGTWSTTDKELFIKVLPHWYNTWWSYALFIVLILSICIGIIIYFVQHERLKQGLIYEKKDKERIETINQGKFRYFTNLSHEFRTPLTLISGPLERIISSNTDKNNTKYLNIIEKNTKRLLTLVDQLITFRQAEQGRVKLNLVKSTLGDFLYPTTEAFEDYALQRNINFFYKITDSNEEIILDVEKVERIMFNLLSNSFKNTNSQDNISIEAGITREHEKTMINIAVIDTGKGIPPENIDNIFERFYQLGSENGNISGGGIGLSFCESLVNLLGGEITAQSKPGIETRFSVKIPSLSSEEYLIDDTPTPEKSYIKDWIPVAGTKEPWGSSNQEKNKEKEYSILVVEDEVDVQNFLYSELSIKYNVVMAGNGLEALEKIEQKMPDLIVSDVMMPEMDGYQLCEKIKSNLEFCHIPVLLLSALGDNDNVIKGLEFGADDYLSKPFSLKHLELRIEKLIKTNIKIKDYFSKNSVLPKEEKKKLELSTRDQEFIENIIEVIEKNLSDSSFGVEELSREIGVSTSHFYRRLKQLTGQVPNVYIRNYRLQRAAEIFQSNQGFNVVEVMYQIGMESNSYFSTSFKKFHGISPSEYLKKL